MESTLITAEQSKKIRSLRLDRSELLSLLQILQERSLAAGDIEVASFQQFNQPNDVYEANKANLKKGFVFYITLVGTDSRKLNGPIDSVFASPNFPDQVASVFFDSSIPLAVRYNYTIRNKLKLFLDFTRPEVLNFSFLPFQETPNGSHFVVSGSDTTWVNGVFHEFEQLLKKYPSRFSWLHKHSVYDVVVWVAGLPLGFWSCYKISPIVIPVLKSAFLQSAFYVYTFLFTLILVRLLFHYTRWIWPLVEFSGSRSSAIKHRTAWGMLLAALGCSLIYDLLYARRQGQLCEEGWDLGWSRKWKSKMKEPGGLVGASARRRRHELSGCIRRAG